MVEMTKLTREEVKRKGVESFTENQIEKNKTTQELVEEIVAELNKKCIGKFSYKENRTPTTFKIGSSPFFIIKRKSQGKRFSRRVMTLISYLKDKNKMKKGESVYNLEITRKCSRKAEKIIKNKVKNWKHYFD